MRYVALAWFVDAPGLTIRFTGVDIADTAGHVHAQTPFQTEEFKLIWRIVQEAYRADKQKLEARNRAIESGQIAAKPKPEKYSAANAGEFMNLPYGLASPNFLHNTPQLNSLGVYEWLCVLAEREFARPDRVCLEIAKRINAAAKSAGMDLRVQLRLNEQEMAKHGV